MITYEALWISTCSKESIARSRPKLTAGPGGLWILNIWCDDPFATNYAGTSPLWDVNEIIILPFLGEKTQNAKSRRPEDLTHQEMLLFRHEHKRHLKFAVQSILIRRCSWIRTLRSTKLLRGKTTPSFGEFFASDGSYKPSSMGRVPCRVRITPQLGPGFAIYSRCASTFVIFWYEYVLSKLVVSLPVIA
jgi:hypothetical protein